jgi:hypothetical protein
MTLVINSDAAPTQHVYPLFKAFIRQTARLNGSDSVGVVYDEVGQQIYIPA